MSTVASATVDVASSDISAVLADGDSIEDSPTRRDEESGIRVTVYTATVASHLVAVQRHRRHAKSRMYQFLTSAPIERSEEKVS